MREEVDKRHRGELVVGTREESDVARERGRVARDEYDALGLARQDRASTVAPQSGPARVGDDDVDLGPLPLTDVGAHDPSRTIGQVVLGIGHRRPSAFDRDDSLRPVGRDGEKADAAVEVGKHAFGTGRLAHESYEGFGPVRPALEERVDRDTQCVAIDHLVHVRRFSAHHIGWKVENRLRGLGERGAFPGPESDAQGHLRCAAEVAIAQ